MVDLPIIHQGQALGRTVSNSLAGATVLLAPKKG
jgi:hypothetical protein